MSWKKRGGDNSKYIKFEAGKSIEGIYMGCSVRDNPFYNPKEPESKINQPTIIDYSLEVNGEEKVISSTAQTLKDQLSTLEPNIKVRIEFVQKGIKKFFIVYTEVE